MMRLLSQASIFILTGLALFAVENTNRPNIIIIMPDDMGWGDAGFNGGKTPTPHLDQLARESLQLDRFYTFPSCSPTRAAVLSGVFPHRLGIPAPVRQIDPGLPEDTPLLPQLLKVAGYHTAMIGKWHLGGENVPAQRPHHRGFDDFYGSYQTGIDYFKHTNSSGKLDWWHNDTAIEEAGYITRLQAKKAEQLIANSSIESPLFLFFAPHAPHTPVQAPADTVAQFSQTGGRNGPTYAAMISEFDDAVGRILHAIDETGQRDNTIVVFFSDNGGVRFSNRGQFRGQKNTIYEGGIRSPFLIRWPAALSVETRGDFVATVTDVAPTLLAAAGVSPEKLGSRDGINLLPYLQSNAPLPRKTVFIAANEFTAITTRWKLVETPTGAELYDLQIDPTESVNRASSESETTAHLKKIIAEFRRDLPEFTPRRMPHRNR
jgi:arylsulfatase A-like enzyme